MKILYIHHGRMIGGAPTSLRNMVTGLQRAHPENEYKIGCVYNEMIGFLEKIENVSVSRYPKIPLLLGRVLSGWSKLNFNTIKRCIREWLSLKGIVKREYDFLLREKPDIVHLNSIVLISSALAAKKAGIPLVWHIREAGDRNRWDLIRNLYFGFIRKTAERVICIGRQEYDYIAGSKSPNVKVIYNSLDDSFFDEKEIDSPADWDKSKYNVLSLGGSSHKKGAFQLIRCIRELPGNFNLVIVGKKPDDPDKKISRKTKLLLRIEDFLYFTGVKKFLSVSYNERLVDLLSQGDADRIRFAGETENVKPFLSHSDVLVFAGTTPHSSRPVYEAWALKKPVIVFDTSVMRQDIDDGVNGLIVGRHTGKALAEKISFLQERPELAKTLGLNGYIKAKERFSLENNTKKVYTLYKEIFNEDCT